MLDASVPGPIRRYKRLEVVAALVILSIVFALGIMVMLDKDIAFVWRVLPAAFLLPFILWLLGSRANTRTLRRAAAHNYLLCPACTYDLRTLDKEGACPECGRAYEHEAVRAQWLDAQRRLKRTSRGGVDREPPA